MYVIPKSFIPKKEFGITVIRMIICDDGNCETLFSFFVSVSARRGWQGLIAQGCHTSILIIDPKTSQTIQVLERHKANVVKVSSTFLFFCL